MSAPRTKRQFAGAASDPAQRQITSFFASNPSPSSSSSSPSSPSPFAADTHYPSRAGAAQGPSLPSSVQTNLLSVGMRIRKSVPEGYKTGSSYGAFALWDESAAATCRPSTPKQQQYPQSIYSSSSPAAESRARSNAFSSPRELLPFCGIHKVGGLGTQPETETETGSLPASYYRAPVLAGGQLAAAAIDDEGDMPGLTSSQDTVASTDSDGSPPTAARTRKRSFSEDEDETSSSLAGRPGLVPVGWGSNASNAGSGRIMAVPRKGRLLRSDNNKKAGETTATAPMPIPIPIPAPAATAMAGGGKAALGGQENVMLLDGDDFDEADFLDRGRSWEVEMGGV